MSGIIGGLQQRSDMLIKYAIPACCGIFNRDSLCLSARCSCAYAGRFQRSDNSSARLLCFPTLQLRTAPSDGVATYEEAYQLFPSDSEAVYGYGWALATSRRFAEAEPVLSKAVMLEPIRISPDDPDA